MQHVSRHSQYDMPTSMADSLPSTGYAIFDERPSPSLSSSQVCSPWRIVAFCTHSYTVLTRHLQPYTSFPNYTPDNTTNPHTRSALSPTAIFVVEHWSFLMLVFVPVGIAAPYLGCNDFGVFVLNCLAIIPLADVLCRATDKVASFLGETTGALVNVTMGNVAELAIFM
jgi:Ca2+:H+ antiporter